MLAWLRNLRQSRSVKKTPRRNPRTRLGFEQLEDRRLMSLSGQFVPFSPVEGISAPPASQTAVATFTDPGASNLTFGLGVSGGQGKLIIANHATYHGNTVMQMASSPTPTSATSPHDQVN